jgi:hypothetical protein
MSKNETVENFQYITNRISEYIPYIVLNSIGSILGLIGSILIIVSILCTKELQNRTNMIIGNIALADFILSSFVDPTAIAGL